MRLRKIHNSLINKNKKIESFTLKINIDHNFLPLQSLL